MILNALNQFSTEVGSNVLLTQGAGGNISLKVDDTLYVKASGTWLSDANDRNIFVPVDLPRIVEDYENTQLNADLATYIDGESNLKPSIETLMHALLPKKVVVHLHAIDILTFSVLKNAKLKLGELQPREKYAWVDYVKPGNDLARSIYQAYLATQANVFILGNHGLLFMADSVKEARGLLDDVLADFYRKPRVTKLALEFGLGASNDLTAWSLAQNEIIQAIAFDANSLKLIDGVCLYPDQVVFMGLETPIMALSAFIEAEKQLAKNKNFIVVPQHGVYINNAATHNFKAQLLGHAMILQRLAASDEISALTEDDIQSLANWDAEKYRKKLEK